MFLQDWCSLLDEYAWHLYRSIMTIIVLNIIPVCERRKKIQQDCYSVTLREGDEVKYTQRVCYISLHNYIHNSYYMPSTLLYHHLIFKFSYST